MNLHSDIVARLKALNIRRREGVGASPVSAVRQWLFVLIFGLALSAAAAAYSIQRFNYWSDIEARVAEESGAASGYDRQAFRSVLDAFEAKASLIDELLPMAASSTEFIETEARNSAASTADSSL